MKKRKPVGIAILIVFLIAVLFLGVLFVPISAQWLSEARHEKAVMRLAQKRYIKSGDRDEITVHAVYDENETLTHFVIEMKPSGFMFVEIAQKNALLGSTILGFGNMYLTTETDKYNRIWARMRICDNGGKPSGVSFIDEKGTERISGETLWAHKHDVSYYDERIGRSITSYPETVDVWSEIDDQGNIIYQADSPYAVYGVKDEKYYLIRTSEKEKYFIPAVKRNGTFFNLISLQEFELQDIKNKEYKEVPGMFLNNYVGSYSL